MHNCCMGLYGNLAQVFLPPEIIIYKLKHTLSTFESILHFCLKEHVKIAVLYELLQWIGRDGIYTDICVA